MALRKQHNLEAIEEVFGRPKNASKDGQPRLVFATAFCHLINDVNTGALPAMVPFLVSQYNYGFAEASLLMLTAHLLGAITQPLFGYLGDKHPRPWLMALGMLMSCGGVCITELNRNSYYLIFLS